MEEEQIPTIPTPAERGRKRLTKDDWTAAGLAVLASGGVAAVAIEPLAARLGATKGSAYWHFPNREALLAAVLDRWREDQTEQVIALLEPMSDPRDRLRSLFRYVVSSTGPTTSTAGLTITLRLHAAADHPAVAAALGDVNRRRIGYLTKLLGELGQPAARARRRAVHVYAAYLGWAQLSASAPDVLPRSTAATMAYVDELMAMALA